MSDLIDTINYVQRTVELEPGESESFALGNTINASDYLATIDTGTSGDLPKPYAHEIIFEVPGGRKGSNGTGIARAIAYSMPGADDVTFRVQNITNLIQYEEQTCDYRVRFCALAFR